MLKFALYNYSKISDVAGRRWLFIGGNVFSLIGVIICAATHSAKNLAIIGIIFAGVGAANQYLALAALSEIVPSKNGVYVQGK